MNVGVSKATEAPNDVVASGEDVSIMSVTMEVNVGRAVVDGGTDSDMSEFFVTRIADIMAAFGIKSIVVNRYASGIGCSISSSAVPFDGVPGSVLQKGMVARDAIALIMSVANLTRIEMKVDEEEYNKLRTIWHVESGGGVMTLDIPEEAMNAQPEESDPSNGEENA